MCSDKRGRMKTIDLDTRKRLEKAMRKAMKEGKTEFDFEWSEGTARMYVPYVEYLLQYLDSVGLK